MIQKLRGTGVALVTPFHENLTIDWESLEKLMVHTGKGVDYYVVMGTTGESATLTEKEKSEVLSFVKNKNKLNLPIVYGMGGNNTKEIIDQLAKTDLNGVEAVLSVSPYYNKPSQEGLFRHYSAIAEKCTVPMILYNVPGRTASNISASTTLRLAQNSNIIGIKEASGNMEQCMEIAKSKPDDFMLISGDDLFTVPLMAIGAIGVISVLANALPQIFKKIVTAAHSSDYAMASKAAFQLLSANPLMYQESNPVGVKCLLKELGICSEWVRLPLIEASEDLRKKIKEIAKEISTQL